jgi:hypothetical protein
MIKVNKKMVDKFLQIMDEYGEFVFGNYKQIKDQLQACLNFQGYWSGCSIRVYYNEETKEFTVKNRF